MSTANLAFTNLADAGAPAGRQPFRRGDGVLFTPADLRCSVPVHRGELDELACVITLLEDWLLHADEGVIAALADFAPEYRAGDLIDDLGSQSVKLHRLTSSISSAD